MFPEEKMRSGRKCLLVFSITIGLMGYPIAAESPFEIVKRAMEAGGLHRRYVLPHAYPMTYGKVMESVRQKSPYTPGDYSLWPIGADTITLNEQQRSEISEQLNENIRLSFYDDFVLQHLHGYEYTIGSDSIQRREYYVSYARGDTIYVISGWLGKFLSFYRAIPGDFRYDTSQLQNEVGKLSPSYRETKDDSFKRIDEEKDYFLEYLDRDNMMRVRNYLVDATFIFDDSRQGTMKKYNLIEITKFIDPEAMP
jgi:hypothetical protein